LDPKQPKELSAIAGSFAATGSGLIFPEIDEAFWHQAKIACWVVWQSLANHDSPAIT
jgi:hypothetical protein